MYWFFIHDLINHVKILSTNEDGSHTCLSGNEAWIWYIGV
nr:hypothetical protein Iba_chr15bCG6580 [Ipomoea batatas]